MKIFIIFAMLLGISLGTRLHAGIRQANLSTSNTTANATTSEMNATSPSVGAVHTGSNMTLNISEFISPLFFVDMNGKDGKDFIALKNNEGFFLNCKDNKLVIDQNSISKDSLWIPVISQVDKKISLRNFNGGYLNFKDNKFDCELRIIADTMKFVVDHNIDLNALKLNDVTDKSELIALKIGDVYLGVNNKVVSPVKQLNKDSVFIAPIKKSESKVTKDKLYFEIISQ
jgi:hypothetical protein